MTDILSVIQTWGIVLRPNGKKHGGEFVGPCPFCREGDDRFHVWPFHNKWEGGGYWCRICGKSGDLIAFFMEMDGLSYGQACQAAGIESKDYGYAKPVLSKRPTPGEVFSPQAYEDPSEKWREKSGDFVERCHEALLKNRTALEKLFLDRGLTEESVRRFKIGMNASDFFRPRESWGLPKEINDKTGKPKKLWIPKGLVIPYLVDGMVMRIRIRRPKEDLKSESDPRYYFVPGSSPAIMRIGEDMRAWVIEETELDGMLIAQEAGDLVGVHALGTAASKPDKHCMDDLSAAEVILVSTDFDKAGRNASGWWLQNFRQAERWPVPEGKDPGDMFKAVDVRAWVLAGLPPAWHVGQSALPYQLRESEEKRETAPEAGADEMERDALPDSYEYPPTVMELGGMLKQYPVKIISTCGRLRIEEAPGWNNESASDRISRLVFFDSEVGEFLSLHPSEVIDGSNFFRVALNR